MIRHIAFIAFLVFADYNGYSQDFKDVKMVTHKSYVSYFSNSMRIPVLVAYTLTKDMLKCGHGKAKDVTFYPDPEIKDNDYGGDYAGTGYQPGFCMNMNYCCDKKERKEALYYTNLAPRPQSLNDGIWAELETEERKQADENDTIKVFVGNSGNAWSFGHHNVVVPKYCWKVIYLPKQEIYLSYIFPNEIPTDEKTYTDYYKQDIAEVEKISGYHFEHGVVIMK